MFFCFRKCGANTATNNIPVTIKAHHISDSQMSDIHACAFCNNIVFLGGRGGGGTTSAVATFTSACSGPSTASLETSAVVVTSPMVSTVVTMKARTVGRRRGGYTLNG